MEPREERRLTAILSADIVGRTCEQWIKESKGAIRCPRLSCRSFAANAVRLQLHALAYNLANVMRRLALLEAVAHWSLASLRGRSSSRSAPRSSRMPGTSPSRWPRSRCRGNWSKISCG